MEGIQVSLQALCEALRFIIKKSHSALFFRVLAVQAAHFVQLTTTIRVYQPVTTIITFKTTNASFVHRPVRLLAVFVTIKNAIFVTTSFVTNATASIQAACLAYRTLSYYQT